MKPFRPRESPPRQCSSVGAAAMMARARAAKGRARGRREEARAGVRAGEGGRGRWEVRARRARRERRRRGRRRDAECASRRARAPPPPRDGKKPRRTSRRRRSRRGGRSSCLIATCVSRITVEADSIDRPRRSNAPDRRPERHPRRWPILGPSRAIDRSLSDAPLSRSGEARARGSAVPNARAQTNTRRGTMASRKRTLLKVIILGDSGYADPALPLPTLRRVAGLVRPSRGRAR